MSQNPLKPFMISAYKKKFHFEKDEPSSTFTPPKTWQMKFIKNKIVGKSDDSKDSNRLAPIFL